MPLRRYLPQPFAGVARFSSDISDDVQNEILQSIIDAAKGGVKAYHIGSRGLERYSLKDRIEAFNKLTELPGAITGMSIAVRRGVPTDT